MNIVKKLAVDGYHNLSDIAIFVLKGDVKLQLTPTPHHSMSAWLTDHF